MINKNIIKYLLYISLIFAFLPSFVLYYAPGRTIPFFMLVAAFIFFAFTFIFPKFLLRILINLYRRTSFKYLCYFFVYIIISGILCYLLQYYVSFTQLLMAIFGAFLLRCILVYVYPSFVINFISLKQIIRFFVIIYLFLFIWGLVEFFGAKYNIFIINKLVYFLSNYKAEDLSVILESHSGLPRIRSVFQEAGFLSKFIAINLPIIYDIALSKYKIFKNLYLNFVTKKTLIPLTWVCIILTQSPIFLLINCIVTLLIFRKQILKIIKKYYKEVVILFFICMICMLLMINSSIFEESFLIRIVKVIHIIPSLTFEELIEVEPSLATRIICYTSLFLLFLKYPIFGIGFTNRGPILLSHMISTGIPLTPELITRFSLYNASGSNIIVNVTTLTELLYQTGIIGVAFYCIFMISTINLLNKAKNAYKGIEYVFVNALKNSILILFIIALTYEQSFIENHTFFYPGLAAAIIITTKNNLFTKRSRK